MLEIEKTLLEKKAVYCGVDEAGVGPLCGSVVAAAVVLPLGLEIEGLKDSKKLTLSQRERLYEEILEKAISFSIDEATTKEIDQINILQARLLAMARAINKLNVDLDYVLVDGNRTPNVDYPRAAIVKGDALVQSIAAASVLAKVTRDRTMCLLDEQYPEYGFAQHKGYGTQQHLAALEKHGPCPLHRQSYAPVKKASALKIS